jgi:hypothetical protein
VDELRRFLWTPIGWLVVQLTEVVIGIALWRRFGARGWVGFVLLVAILGGLGVLNLWFRRRFLTWEDQPDSHA